MPVIPATNEISSRPQLSAATEEEAMALVNRWLHCEVGMALNVESAPDFAENLNNLARLYVATQREGEGLVLMQQAALIVSRTIGQVFSIGSESQRMAYIEITWGNFYVLLSLVIGHLFDSAEAVRAALDLVLRCKAIGAEALAAQRDAAYWAASILKLRQSC